MFSAEQALEILKSGSPALILSLLAFLYFLYPTQFKTAFHQVFKEIPGWAGEKAKKWKTKDEIETSINAFRESLIYHPFIAPRGVKIVWCSSEEKEIVNKHVILRLNYENRDKSYAKGAYEYVSTEVFSGHQSLVESYNPHLSQSVYLSLTKEIVNSCGRASTIDEFNRSYLIPMLSDSNLSSYFNRIDDIRRDGLLYSVFLTEIKKINDHCSIPLWEFNDDLDKLIDLLYRVATKVRGVKILLPHPFRTDYTVLDLFLIGDKPEDVYFNVISRQIIEMSGYHWIYVIGAGEKISKAKGVVKLIQDSKPLKKFIKRIYEFDYSLPKDVSGARQGYCAIFT
jgi:hypothetical protein